MDSIKFSHRYFKLMDKDGEIATRAKLLDVIDVRLQKLSEVFKRYDTHFKFDPQPVHYKLPPKGNYLLLIFWGNNDQIFTTLRAFRPGKKAYYKSKIGKEFRVEVKDGTEKAE